MVMASGIQRFNVLIIFKKSLSLSLEPPLQSK
jgi:hypothetical protein